jgi:hypothetical protein
LPTARRSATIPFVAKGFGCGLAAAGVFSLALVGCGSSGPGSGGGNPTLTDYSGCLPPCLYGPLSACVGNATACTTAGPGICWDTGAIATITAQHPDGGGLVQQTAISSPSGAICFTQIVSAGTSGIPGISFYDGAGDLLATTTSDLNTPTAYVINCDGKSYAGKRAFPCSGCTDNSPILLGNGCLGSVKCPP